MHHVDARKRQKLILRFFSYGLMSALTVITTIVLLFVALGYRFDNKSGEVVRSGLLLVDSKPVAAQVTVDGENKDDETPSRFVLTAGKYTLNLVAEGYRNWSKPINLLASTVENTQYARLIPAALTARSIRELPTPELISQLPDRSAALMYSRAEPTPFLVKLDVEDPEVEKLSLPASFVRANGSLGVLRVRSWSEDSRFALVQQQIGGQSRLLKLDMRRPEQSVDLTARFGENLAQKPVFKKNDNILVGLVGTQFREYNIEQGTSKQLLSKVVNFAPFGDEAVAFVREKTDESAYEAGVLNNGKVVIVHNGALKAGTPLVSYREFRGNFYLAVQLPGESAATIYRNPLDNPILSKQLPYSSLRLKNVQEFSFSSNSQFLMARSASKLAVYDFEHDRQYLTTLPAESSGVKWLDSYHLVFKAANNKNFIINFDGENRYELLPSHYGSTLFSSDFEFLYRIHRVNNKVQLQATSLIAR